MALPWMLDLGLILTLLSLAVFFFLRYRVKMAHLNSVLSGERGKLQSLISSLTDGVLLLDSNNRVLIFNPITSALLNINLVDTAEYSITIDQLFSSFPIISEIKNSIDKSRQSGQIVKLPAVDFNNKHLSLDIEPVRDHHSGWMVIVIRDVTPQKQLERVHEEFTAMMIHELRTPLTTISYSTHMLLSDLNKMSTQDLESQVDLIQSTSQRLLSLVNDLLDVAKIEAGKIQLVKEVGDYQNLLEEKSAVFRPLVEQKHLQLLMEIDPNLKQFSFDANRIGQVLDNLLSNALKYTKQGQISLLVKLNPGEIVTSVVDTGDGILPADLTKLFSKFTQVGKGRSGEVKGTGLGLVVAKGIVEAHGGKIWVKSEGEGQGSTFAYSLPYESALSVPVTPISAVNPWASI